ncbi:flavin-containing monooxygenase [Parasphingorhabdus cellanae]|uniref:NAD(P)/FAD-dependent oxidoreductase n=1 Tax=Parasphingorhabdus cellanae TaxID=2806553 RepID=A0ABX7T986_9SPHN|nr:NAD(P)/FAD-dependent oxidoreductase [Parasphingorhabdus cellanae]QTD57089.1 NAD(P)/FAD-dependent oxidoreductase [Parasphingorhabdus cellanae]
MENTKHFDNLIVGAGLSGISAAHYLQKRSPHRSFAILERRADIGGTWDLFKYPGIRSDSDMHTLGFAFKPWVGAKAIADGPDIMAYLHETVDELALREQIAFHRSVLSADYDSARAIWTLAIQNGITSQTETWTCNFLHLCSGYYDYDEGHTPSFDGQDKFKGQIVHQQFWPQDLDYAGKRVVVIGSGATAITVVPAMAETAGHVVMLQRTPSYVVKLEAKDAFANRLRKWLPGKLAYALTRWRNVLANLVSYRLARRYPERAKKFLLKEMRKHLPREIVTQHFTPSYDPWDQRVCVVPDGDLFTAIREKRASVVSDHIAHFTEDGIMLASGEMLHADIIVLATGLKLNVFGGAKLSRDGKPIVSGDLMTYKGMMFGGVPNLAVTTGYTNSSWTLKADLVSEYIGRLMTYMDKRQYVECAPMLNDPNMDRENAINFTSGYVQRASHFLPKQGSRWPWKLAQNYALDIRQLRFGKLDDGVMQFRQRAELTEAVTKEKQAKQSVA